MKPDFRKQQHDFNAVWSQTNALYCRWAEYFGLNYITLMTLYGLDIYGSMTPKNLCDFYGFPKQTVNGVVHELAEQGYVSLRPGSKDKREKLVCLTETGAAYAKELLAPLYRAEQSVFSVLGEEKIIQMFETISAFNALMEKKLEAEE